jgi:hypothetical protein
VRLDTGFPRNPKLLAMINEKDGYRAGLVYICGLAYAGEQGTDGFVPREALTHLHGREADAEKLVRHRLWVPQTGGWTVNGWAEFQESTGESRDRRKRAQAAAQARWAGHEAVTDAERQRRSRARRRSGRHDARHSNTEDCHNASHNAQASGNADVTMLKPPVTMLGHSAGHDAKKPP